MQLSELIKNINCQTKKIRDIEVKSLEFDSRKIKPGSVFIAISGNNIDGHDFVDQAQAGGAVAVVTQRILDTTLPQIIVSDSREAMGKLAKKFYFPRDHMTCIGITGTNGKTTTAFLIHSILENAGKQPGLIGTIYYMGKSKIKAARTTPESLDLFKLINQYYAEGSRDIVMEVSSHALSLKRVEEMEFTVVLFTNLSQDHLDFHETIDEYKTAKLHLFSLLRDDGYAVFNLDDAVSKDIGTLNIKNQLTFGFNADADITASILNDSLDGLKIKVVHHNVQYLIHSKLVGEYNGYNIMAAFGVGTALGLEQGAIVGGLEKLESIRGRMEMAVPNVFVDFAHTPKALENILKTLRKYVKGKLIVVFGCGGDRDKDKRPKMGRVAATLADYSIITSDNPRSETPSSIINDIEKGMEYSSYRVIEDRKKAIGYALKMKQPKDIVLIAGKGHEENQILSDRIVEFDDIAVARAIAGTGDV